MQVVDNTLNRPNSTSLTALDRQVTVTVADADENITLLTTSARVSPAELTQYH